MMVDPPKADNVQASALPLEWVGNNRSLLDGMLGLLGLVATEQVGTPEGSP